MPLKSCRKKVLTWTAILQCSELMSGRAVQGPTAGPGGPRAMWTSGLSGLTSVCPARTEDRRSAKRSTKSPVLRATANAERGAKGAKGLVTSVLGMCCPCQFPRKQSHNDAAWPAIGHSGTLVCVLFYGGASLRSRKTPASSVPKPLGSCGCPNGLWGTGDAVPWRRQGSCVRCQCFLPGPARV